MRLKEKQKLKYHYALKEKQLVNYVRKAKKNRSRAWMETLITTLERRLNNVVFRLNFAPSIASASQIVRHGHVFVNGKKVSVSGYLIEKGDVITLTEKAYSSVLFLQSQENPRIPTVPACYNLEKDGGNKIKASLMDYPIKEDIPFAFEDQLVTEYYWRI
jgi:small subunit ribosomal protein S4